VTAELCSGSGLCGFRANVETYRSDHFGILDPVRILDLDIEIVIGTMRCNLKARRDIGRKGWRRKIVPDRRGNMECSILVYLDETDERRIGRAGERIGSRLNATPIMQVPDCDAMGRPSHFLYQQNTQAKMTRIDVGHKSHHQ
jgi:hypothetical protein